MHFHYLDAARVIGEYLVVSYHLEGYWVNSAFLSSHGLNIDLMSFFFVLSGFVVAHNYTSSGKPGLAYLRHRVCKVFPLYLTMWILDLPQCIVAQYVHKSNSCAAEFWVHLLSQLMGLQWIVGWEVGGSNPPAWYMETLIWLWVVYSAADWNKLLCKRPLTWMWFFYAMSLIMCMALMQVPIDVLKQLPVIRICEFLMGCCSALAVRKGHKVQWLWAVAAFIVYMSYVVMTMLFPEIWPETHTTRQRCTFWQISNEYVFTPANLITCTSLLWAIIIQYLAGAELSEHDLQEQSGEEAPRHFNCFKIMSTFSLELYLSHYVIKVPLMWALNYVGILQIFPKDLYILLIYSAAYTWHVKAQPLLNWLVRP